MSTTLNVVFEKPRTPAPLPPYFIMFSYAPDGMKFLLKKMPRFATKRDAFRALANYEFEFGVEGNVFTQYGMEREEVPMTEEVEA
jgi:hypothetical protein